MSDQLANPSESGYRFEPAGAADQPSHRKFIVVIRSQPNDVGFDPDKVSCTVADSQGEADSLLIFHPWPYASDYRVVAGRVMVTDRHDQKLEAFTFGGSLHLDSSEAQTTATFESPAPLLALLPENPFLSRVAARCEALLAQRQAAWDSKGQSEQYLTRLGAADPQALYQACLSALAEALAGGSGLGRLSDKTLEHFIAAEHRPGAARLDDLL